MEGLRLPQAVQRIVEEGSCLWVDSATGCYEVTDGPLFQARFNALRRRKQQGDEACARAFSGMHRYFTLLSGDGWGRTGSKFCPKAREAAAPAPPKPSGSWFVQDVKYWYQWGQGSTSEQQLKCSACDSSEWTLAAGENRSLIGTFLAAVRAETAIYRRAKTDAAHQEDDIIVTASQQEALAALKALVAAARAAETMQENDHSERGRCSIWDLRGVHLGAGICVTKTRDDLFLAFIIWAEQEPGSFNVSKALRRLQAFAKFQEENFEAYLSEPIDLAELAKCDVETSLPASKTASGHRWISYHRMNLPWEFTGERVKEIIRCNFGIALCLIFDDVSVKCGVLWVEDMCDATFNAIMQWCVHVEWVHGSVLSHMWYQAAPISFCGYHAFISRSASWWFRWAVNVYSFLGLDGIKVHYCDEERADLSSYFGAAQDGSWPIGVSTFARWVAGARGRCRIGDSAEAPGAIFSSSSRGNSSDTAMLALPALGDSSHQHPTLWTPLEEGNAAAETWMSNGETDVDGCPFWPVLVDMEPDLGGDVGRVRGPSASAGEAGGLATTSEARGLMERGEAAPLLAPGRGRGGSRPAGAGWTRREGEEGEEGEEGGEKGGEGATVEEDKVNARLYEYGVVHMKIAPAEFKATALSRIRDLYQLLQTLETKGAVRACSEGAGGKVGGEPMSIFGFSRLFVSDVNAFNAGVRSMVQQVAGSGSWVRDSHYLAYHRIRDSHYLAYHIVCEYCYPAYPIVREYHYL